MVGRTEKFKKQIRNTIISAALNLLHAELNAGITVGALKEILCANNTYLITKLV